MIGDKARMIGDRARTIEDKGKTIEDRGKMRGDKSKSGDMIVEMTTEETVSNENTRSKGTTHGATRARAGSTGLTMRISR
jgi:hypothetical protein